MTHLGGPREGGGKKTARLSNGLTARESKFVEAYVGAAAGHGIKAVEIAGLSPNGNYQTKATMASKLLKRPAVRAVLADLQEHDPLVVNREERLRLLSAIARGEVKDKLLILPGEDGGTVERIAANTDRLKALEQLAKAAGEPTRIEIKTDPAKMSDDALVAMLKESGVQLPGITDTEDEPEEPDED